MGMQTKQFYKEADIHEMKAEFRMITARHAGLLLKINKLSENLTQETARRYLHYGVCRRLGILGQCVQNIRTIFPLERKTPLSWDRLHDVDINLHAFLFNVFGLLDNLAWVFVCERQLANRIHRVDVGLFSKKTKREFPKEFREYLSRDGLKKWHDEYLKIYRDALAHGIPPYVPPQLLTPAQRVKFEQLEKQARGGIKAGVWSAVEKLRRAQGRLGRPGWVLHLSLSDDTERSMYLHPQLIADFRTVEQITERFCVMLTPCCDSGDTSNEC